MGERRCAYRVWWGNLREGNHFEGPSIDERIIIKWIFKKCGVEAWTRSIWFRNLVVNLLVL
jgi:hypothetical protein